MRTTRWLFLSMVCSLVVAHFACNGDDGNNMNGGTQCSDGQDNNGDGTKDYPADPSCNSKDDDSEDGLVSAKCDNEIDDDGDGKTDFPNDPGCFAAQQDSEDDDCPDGPGCPQCANGKDDDMNGTTDFPSDSGGCTAASDTDEYTRNPVACGAGVNIKTLPFTGKDSGMLMAGGQSQLMSPTCGGTGTEVVYEIRAQVPKVIVATTDLDNTMADTVLSLRSSMCADPASEVMCNDNVITTDKQSTLTVSISTPGTYYLIVDSKDSLGGMYDLQVKYFIGEGTMCLAPDECGPGLVCRTKKGDTIKTCSKHVCEDGLDEDNDGKNDYPQDPGCLSLTDDDEIDGCPGVGLDCPECGDAFDNDGDGGTDFGGTMPDATCKSAGDSSEACVSSEGVSTITTAMTTGNTTGMTNDSKPTCASSTSTAPDLMYRLDLPAMATLNINTTGFDTATALYNSTCGGTEVKCSDPPLMTHTNVTAGTYYFLVDGWGSTSSGAFTITVSGTIQNGGNCDGALAMAGAITCGTGYTCVSNTCQPAQCSDGLDNEAAATKDNKIDYPADPGCASPADNDEADPATAPVCSDGIDNDNPLDGQTDYPADYGCAAASGTTEAFCIGEVDATARITTKTTTGTTAGAAGDSVPSCASSSTAPEKAFALLLPVPVASLQVDTIGSAFDTVLAMKSLDCTTAVACNDDGGGGGTSKITQNNVAAGGYAVIVDGYQALNGAFTLNIQGTVAQGTVCNSSLFTGGANAVLLCPAGTTCKGTPTPKCLP